MADDSRRRYTVRYRGLCKELTVWLGTPAADIDYAVRKLFALPPSAPALLFSVGADDCALSSHAPDGTLFDAVAASDAAADGPTRSTAANAGAAAREWSAFGVTPEDLRWARFERPGVGLPSHLSTSYSFCDLRARECRDVGKPFVDTEPASLDVPELPRPQQISSCMRSDEQTTSFELEMVRADDDRRRKNQYVREVLARVQVWRRPQQYAPEPALFPCRRDANEMLHVRPASLPAPTAGAPAHMPFFAKCGIFSDTFFALALSIVSGNPDQLANLFVSCEHSDVGLYSFQFSQDEPTFGTDGWRCVCVDDSIPCGEDLRPVLASTESRNELWAVLLHKAYAKFLGSYSHLHVGDTARVLRHMTGVQPDVLEWDAGVQLRPATSRRLWWRLTEASRLGLPCVVMRKHTTCPLVSDVFAADERRSTSRNGGQRPVLGSLRPVPAETLLNWENGVLLCMALEVPTGPRARDKELLLKLRSPYGGLSWTGDWSDMSPLWTKQTRELLGHRQVDDHVTWMRLSDFANEYDTALFQTTYSLVSAAAAVNPSPAATFFRQMEPSSTRAVLCERAHQFLVEVSATDPSVDISQEHVTILLHLSQPCLPEKEPEPGGAPPTGPRPVPAELLVFNTKIPGELVEVEYDEPGPDDVADETEAADARQGSFAPGPLRVELTPAEDIGSPRSKGVVVTGAQGEYCHRHTVSVTCGSYVVVVLQQTTNEALDYCLHVAADASQRLHVDVQEGGSAAEPRSAPRCPMTPEQRLIRTNPAARPSVTQYL